MKNDYYTILGVTRNDSPEDIQRAYRKGARRYHPDVNKETGAEERFKLLNEAYSVLSDPQKRKLYDRWGKDWQQAGQHEAAHGGRPFEDMYQNQGGDFTGHRDSYEGRSYFYGASGSAEGAGYEDILKDIFGSGFNAHREFGNDFDNGGRPVHADLTLSFDELIRRDTKTITFRIDSADSHGAPHRQNKTILVKIPPGVTEGSTMRLKGQGAPGHNNGPAGDLFLKIKISPDSRFAVEGYDLYSEISVTPWEAALGAKVDVETTNGFARLKIPPATQSGRQFRLRGKGLAKKQGSGDLLVNVKIVVPESLSDTEKKLFEELAGKSTFDPRNTRRKKAFEEAA